MVYVALAIGVVVGWVANDLWDGVTGWCEQVWGGTGGFLWDLFALVGIVATCVGVAWWATT